MVLILKNYFYSLNIWEDVSIIGFLDFVIFFTEFKIEEMKFR